LGVRESARRHGEADASTTVWYDFWSCGIIGPFFFENEQGAAVTVNGERYRAMLNEFLLPKFEEEDIDDIWFQQNGAPCHTANATIDLLRTVFENRIITEMLMSIGRFAAAI